MNRLGQFLRDQRETIVAAWLHQVRGLPAAREETAAELRDHVPQLLDELARALDTHDSISPALEGVILEHARSRFLHGYDIREVVTEYQLLRRAMMDARAKSPHPQDTADFAMLNEVIDLAIGVSVDCFMLQRDRARDIFVSILGHDLRSPLAALTAAADILTSPKGQTPETVGRVGERMRTSVLRMGEMIDGLLDFARTHFGGGIPIDPREIDLCALLREVIDELSIANRGRELVCRVPDPDGDYRASADPTRIAQVITNLVRNAVEHGRDPIVVMPTDEGETIRVDVTSEGTIPADIASHLFKPFAHLSQAKSTAHGLGLGLFIVAEIARAHGGRAWLDTSDESHVRFSLRIRKRPPRGEQ